MWKGIVSAVSLGIALGGGAFWLALAIGGDSPSTVPGKQVAVVLPPPLESLPPTQVKEPSSEPKGPIQKEPAQKEPVRKEPARTKPVRQVPVRKKSVRDEQVQSQPVQEELAGKEQVQEESAVREEPTQETLAPVPASAPAALVEMGTLSLNSSPWAQVTVDGVPMGRTPLTLKLPAGTHHVVLSCSVLPERTHEMQVEIQAGRTVRRTHYFRDL